MKILYFIFGVSITLNFITLIGLYILYRKFIRNNPLSDLYDMPKKKKKNEDIISRIKSNEMENWDL